jgi:hypothetical protein
MFVLRVSWSTVSFPSLSLQHELNPSTSRANYTYIYRLEQHLKQDRQLRSFRLTIVAVVKQKLLYILSVCLELYFSQHAMLMRQVILSSVACLAVPYFSHCIIKCTIFIKNIIDHKMYLLIFSTNLSAIFLILSRI